MAAIDKNARYIQKRINQLLSDDPELVHPFKKIRKSARQLRIATVYDITSKCNLSCEGCYYFEGEEHPLDEEKSLNIWESLFSSEQKRGISFGYFAGAEPAIAQETLLVASQYIPRGMTATNGTIKIDPIIPYRIGVSIWGDEEITARLRGRNTFWKAIRNYEGDPRALFAYTITPKNIDKISYVANVCKDHDIELSFNMFSPTTSYLRKIKNRQKNDGTISTVSSHNNLCFSSKDLKYCHKVVAKLIEDFPETIVYPHPFNDEVTRNAPIFKLDKDGTANNCAGRHNGTHKTYLSNLQLSDRKCCTPNLSCEECRHLTTYLPSRLRPTVKDLVDKASFIDWLEICEFWAWFYLGKEYKLSIRQTLKK